MDLLVVVIARHFLELFHCAIVRNERTMKSRPRSPLRSVNEGDGKREPRPPKAVLDEGTTRPKGPPANSNGERKSRRRHKENEFGETKDRD